MSSTGRTAMASAFSSSVVLPPPIQSTTPGGMTVPEFLTPKGGGDMRKSQTLAQADGGGNSNKFLSPISHGSSPVSSSRNARNNSPHHPDGAQEDDGGIGDSAAGSQSRLANAPLAISFPPVSIPGIDPPLASPPAIIAEQGSSFKDLYDDMNKKKVKTGGSPLLATKTEMMAEKKDRVRKEIKTIALSNEEREYYVEAFCIFDIDGSGTIDVEELGAVMESLGLEVTEKEIIAMMYQIDQDGNGEISVVEFVELMATVRARGSIVETEADIRQAFDLIDQDHDGFIQPQDIVAMFASVGEKITMDMALDMVRVTDTDLDAQVDFAEFHKMITSTANTKTRG